MAKRLQEQGLNYLVLERDAVGQVWDNRLEGMKLFTSRQFCQLPGLVFPGEQWGFPSVIEMAEYLRCYAATFKLNIRQQSGIVSMEKVDGIFLIKTDDGLLLSARTVINATGANQSPLIPKLADGLSKSVIQHSSNLTSLTEINSNARVLVVGDGANNNADMVIPPMVASNPIAGSLPLANLMGLSTVAERGFVIILNVFKSRFNERVSWC